MALPHHPAVLFLCTYPKKTKALIWKDMYLPMFTTTLFTITKIGKQLNCTLMDEWIRIIHTHIHTLEYYSVVEKEWNLAICNNRNGPKGYLLIATSQRNTNTVWFYLYVGSKKINDTQQVSSNRTERNSQTQKTNWWSPEGRERWVR